MHIPKMENAPHQRKELDDTTRNQMVGMRLEGAKWVTIAEKFDVNESTIRSIMKRSETTGATTAAPRTGRPKKLNEHHF